jgi:hypothetical protein
MGRRTGRLEPIHVRYQTHQGQAMLKIWIHRIGFPCALAGFLLSLITYGAPITPSNLPIPPPAWSGLLHQTLVPVLALMSFWLVLDTRKRRLRGPNPGQKAILQIPAGSRRILFGLYLLFFASVGNLLILAQLSSVSAGQAESAARHNAATLMVLYAFFALVIFQSWKGWWNRIDREPGMLRKDSPIVKQ